MNKVFKRIVIIGVVAVLAACGTAEKKDDGEVSVEERGTGSTVTDGGGDAASTSGITSGSSFRGHKLDDPASPLSTRVIYFDYDSSDIQSRFRPVVEAHANYLAENPGARVTLEGHADERGTREYNLGLGERRSKSVQSVMRLLGVSDDQVRLVSYGEERPIADGHDEAAWSQNRRVEILYRVR